MATDIVYCARHPKVETGLLCGRCETPICPKCAVFTDVGARCPDCAPRRKMPQLELGFTWMVRAAGAAAVVGIATGALWGLALPNTAGFLTLAIGGGIGYCVGESVSVATNRKIGTSLQIIAALGAVLAYVAHNVVAGYPIVPMDDLWGGLAVLVAIFVGAGRLRL